MGPDYALSRGPNVVPCTFKEEGSLGITQVIFKDWASALFEPDAKARLP